MAQTVFVGIQYLYVIVIRDNIAYM